LPKLKKIEHKRKEETEGAVHKKQGQQEEEDGCKRQKSEDCCAIEGELDCESPPCCALYATERERERMDAKVYGSSD